MMRATVCNFASAVVTLHHCGGDLVLLCWFFGTALVDTPYCVGNFSSLCCWCWFHTTGVYNYFCDGCIIS